VLIGDNPASVPNGDERKAREVVIEATTYGWHGIVVGCMSRLPLLRRAKWKPSGLWRCE